MDMFEVKPYKILTYECYMVVHDTRPASYKNINKKLHHRHKNVEGLR